MIVLIEMVFRRPANEGSFDTVKCISSGVFCHCKGRPCSIMPSAINGERMGISRRGQNLRRKDGGHEFYC